MDHPARRRRRPRRGYPGSRAGGVCRLRKHAQYGRDNRGKGPFTVKSSDSAIVPVPTTITGASFVIVPKNVLTLRP